MKELILNYKGSSFDALDQQMMPSLVARIRHSDNKKDLQAVLEQLRELSFDRSPRQVTLVLVNRSSDLMLPIKPSYQKVADITRAGYRIGLTYCPWFVPFLLCHRDTDVRGLLSETEERAAYDYGSCYLILRPEHNPFFSLPRFCNFGDPINPYNGCVEFLLWFKSGERRIKVSQLLSDVVCSSHFLFVRE